MKKNKQQYTPVRFSHLMSYAGVGAIVRGAEDKLMAVTDIRYWTDKSGQIASDIIPCVTRVSMALNIDKELRMPPKAQENERGEIDGSILPAVLFPVYAKCQKCSLLHNNPWRKQDKRLTENVLCEMCESNLEQITWCAVSNKGHMSEVPWHYICHQNSDTGCRADFESSYIKFDTDANGKRIVLCTRCKSENYYENAKINVINGIQPWIYEKAPILDKDDVVEILEVNNPGVYLPERVNALVIPPESRKSKSTIAYKLFSNNSFLVREINNISNKLLKKSKLKRLATEYRCSIEEIELALEEGEPCNQLDLNPTDVDLIYDEYQAFLNPLQNIKDNEDFITVHKTDEFHALHDSMNSSELKSIISMIDNHIVATRLREIQVFKGFYRAQQEEDDNLVPPDIVGESNWLPAIELFGEGIFFTIDEEILSKWEGIPSVRKRADEILKRYEKSEVNLNTDVEITPRFLLLHTLSHLLIRELESTAGYPAASLKERIYCSRDRKMAGVLIYTTVADIVGSL
ncbi:MAG: DUF1998 domain-containing protein, partial [Bacteroidales bacterium]|nr:DUF1998 domain-containing protein [Bacteroidales bacterium]